MPSEYSIRMSQSSAIRPADENIPFDPQERPVIREADTELGLDLVARESFVSVAAAFVEHSASAFGFRPEDALPLTLAAEETFVYLCRIGAPGAGVRISCRGRVFYVEVEFLFQPHEFDMRAFNLAAPSYVGSDGAGEETGLLIASRMVERFHFHLDEQGLQVGFRKEKTYPEEPLTGEKKPRSLENIVVRTPDEAELKELIRLARLWYSRRHLITDFNHPGKVVDMMTVGALFALVVVDRAGRIGGGLLWSFQSAKAVVCYGPYVFDPELEAEISEELVNGCLGAIAKSSAVGLISHNPPPQFPTPYFERLGSLSVCTEDSGESQTQVYYRHLVEDPGTTVWAHPQLHDFLIAEYRRLDFGREVLAAQDRGEQGSPYSVVSAEFDKTGESVTLRPVWWGNDATETVAANVDILRREGIRNIFLDLDLGKPWQSHFTPSAYANGFVPKLVLPYGGKGDIVVFQLQHRG